MDFYFPDKYYSNIGFTIHNYSFRMNSALADNLKNALNPLDDLVNSAITNNTELVDNNLTSDLFFDETAFLQKVQEYKAIPTKKFINESFLLYDKSNTIKKTFITALNKQLSIYGSFSYFSRNTSIKKLTLLDV